MVQPDFVFRGHQAAVNSVCFFGDDRFLVSGDQDGHLVVWNMMLKRQLAKATSAHSAAVLAVCGLGADTIVSQGRDNKLCIWTLQASEFAGDLRLVKSLAIDSMNFCKFAHSSSSWIAFLTDAGAGAACLLNVSSGEQHSLDIGLKSQTKAGSRDDSPMCLKLVALHEPPGMQLFAGYESTMLQQFDITESNNAMSAVSIRSVTTGHEEPIMSIDYDAQRQLVYTCAADSKVRCFSTADASGFKTHAAFELKNPGCSEIRCFPEQALVAVAGWDYAVHLLTSDLEPTSNLVFHRAALTCIDMSSQSTNGLDDIVDEYVRQRWSSRSRWMAVASRDTRISLWDMAKRQSG
ncbi:Guanine nucleotide binding protein (G protein), beta polypeptide 1-like [Coemansia sp. BCRC 34301]|nr:Guanine nucleotide binding protein (G protein), beta polypeptide 1-like [Coemansia sp. BCRC 34301]